jgi:hypothetical protein
VGRVEGDGRLALSMFYSLPCLFRCCLYNHLLIPLPVRPTSNPCLYSVLPLPSLLIYPSLCSYLSERIITTLIIHPFFLPHLELPRLLFCLARIHILLPPLSIMLNSKKINRPGKHSRKPTGPSNDDLPLPPPSRRCLILNDTPLLTLHPPSSCSTNPQTSSSSASMPLLSPSSRRSSPPCPLLPSLGTLWSLPLPMPLYLHSHPLLLQLRLP